MDLARLSINLRPRTHWEGIDLGFRLARHWFLPLWLLWLGSALPIFLVVNLLLPIPLWLAGILTWWFKPLFEPPLVYWLGRAAFSERPGTAELRRNWWRIVRNQLLANLTWRRLAPSRSFSMPVVVLEGLSGAGRAARIRILSQRQHAASWLTLIGLHFEIVLELGLFILLLALIPDELRDYDYWEYLFEPTGWQQWLQQSIGLLAMSLIAPFYVAAGFGLYLTRRGELEAWDIELGFRKLAKRVQAGLGTTAGLLLLGIGLMGLSLPTQPLHAVQITRQEARTVIDLVMQDDDFGQRETRSYWRYIGSNEADIEAESGLPWWLEWLIEMVNGFTRGLATAGEMLLWLALGGLLVYLVNWFLQNRGLLGGNLPKQTRRRELPPVVSGLDIRPESLPEDIPTEAMSLLRRGEKRAAVSLLYRGSLSALIYRHRLKVPRGATEGECLELAGEVLNLDAMKYQLALTRAWRRLAYAHGSIEPRVLEGLCREWSRVYGQ